MWLKYKRQVKSLVRIKQPIVKNINWLNHLLNFSETLKSSKKVNFINFFLIILLCWSLFQLVRISAIAYNLKSQLLGKIEIITNQFNQKPDFTDLSQISTEIENIEETLKDIQEINNSFSKSTLNLSNLSSNSKNLKILSQIGLLLTDSGKRALNSQALFKQISFNNYSISGYENIKFLASELSLLQNNLISANQLLKNHKWSALDSNYANKLKSLSKILDTSINNIEQIQQITQLCELFLDSKKNYLILLQNQNELRATGGFIGSFANFSVNNGNIQKIYLTSIYDIDGQLTEKIVPPEPIFLVNDRWYLRDANWFVDYPQSAKKIIEFFEKEGGETPDFVFAITPKIIAALITLLGPVQLENGKLITAENLVEQLQFLTQQNLLSSQNQPKQILATLMDKLLTGINQLPAEKKAQIPKIFLNNLQNKQILIYANNHKTQAILDNFNWSGKIHNTSKDFLYVNASNLNGSKTDLYIDQELELATQINQQGNITNTLTIKRKNNLPEGKYTANLVYLRILVPKGSKFIEAQGFSNVDIPKLDLNAYKTDISVKAWEKKLLRDVTSSTTIGEEADKTFFANWLEVKADTEAEAKITYELPFKVNAFNTYSIIFQKQPGANDQRLSHKIIAENKDISWHNLPNPQIANQTIDYHTTLNKDLIFGILFRDYAKNH